ncbi:choice-of-anchor A family protein [Candidatus Peregrinibacteria bacterium]|nr:choice-of-anchor A family protein [Candidatus Peregrinibacteria bacterium]
MRRRGFTMMEMLMTVGMIALITSLAIPSYRQYSIRNDLALARTQVVQGLQRAKLNTIEGKGGTVWSFYAPQGLLFAGSDLATVEADLAAGTAATTEVFPMPSTIQFSGLTDAITFNRKGTPSAVGTIILTAVNGDQTTVVITIEIDSQKIVTTVGDAITICHHNNPDQTLSVTDAEWPARQAQGDTIGACPPSSSSSSSSTVGASSSSTSSAGASSSSSAVSSAGGSSSSATGGGGGGGGGGSSSSSSGGGGSSDVSGFNVVVFGDDKQTSDVEGRLAVGGNAVFHNFSVGSALSFDASRYDLIVGGNLNFTNGSVSNGKVYVGGTATLTGVGVGGTVQGPPTPNPIDFAAARITMRNQSNAYGAKAVNGTTSVTSWKSITLNGTDPLTNVFALRGSDLGAATSLTINAPAGSKVIVNIDGTADQMKNFETTITGTDRRHVLYNFTQATSLQTSSIAVEGTILAPWATLDTENGHTDGQIAVESISGPGGTEANGQTNFVGGGFFTTLQLCPGKFTFNPSTGIMTTTALTSVTFKNMEALITYGAGGPQINVHACESDDGGSHFTHLFGGTGNCFGDGIANGNAVKPNGTDTKTLTIGANSPVIFRSNAHFEQPGWLTYDRSTQSNDQTGRMVFLRNGDIVPSVPGFAGQQSLKAYLQGQAMANSSNTMTVGACELVIATELGSSISGPAADFQDDVMDIKFE